MVLLLFTNCSIGGRAQDPNFSQYFNAPIYFNPAFTGLNQGLHVNFNFRDQWPKLPVDFKSYYFSADLGDRSLPGSGGLGISVMSDNEGIGFIQDLSVGLNLAVRIPITHLLTSQLGFRVGVVQKSLHWDEFVFSDEVDELYGLGPLTKFVPPDNNKRVFPDFAVGGLLQLSNENENIFGTAGFSVDHLFTPDQSFLSNGACKLPRKVIFHADAIFQSGVSSYYVDKKGLSDQLKFNPGILFQNQGTSNQLMIGMNLLKFNLYLGGWYKTTMKDNPSKTLVLLAGYRYVFADKMSLKFMYTYDLEISGPLMGTGGAHEISLILNFDDLSIFGGNAMPKKHGRELCPI